MAFITQLADQVSDMKLDDVLHYVGLERRRSRTGQVATVAGLLAVGIIIGVGIDSYIRSRGDSSMVPRRRGDVAERKGKSSTSQDSMARNSSRPVSAVKHN